MTTTISRALEHAADIALLLSMNPAVATPGLLSSLSTVISACAVSCAQMEARIEALKVVPISAHPGYPGYVPPPDGAA